MLFLKSLLVPLAFVVFAAADKKIISYDIKKTEEHVPFNSTLILGKSSGNEQLNLKNQYKLFYTIDLEFGSNKETVSLDIDTGSSDLWTINSVIADKYNNQLGVFNSAKSKTYHNLNKEFVIKYLDGSNATGTYAKDDIWLPSGDVLKQAQFGDVNKTTSSFGIIGVGLTPNEASTELGEGEYDNFPIALKKQGLINTAGFSINLDKINDNSGSIIFGGYDTTKYKGNFPELPFLSNYDYSINLRGARIGGSEIPIFHKAVLDSGTTLTLLTEPLYHSFGRLLGKWDSYYQTYVWDKKQPSDKFITYQLDGVDINVPYSELVYPLYDPITQREVPGRLASIGIDTAGDIIILGDTFLRSAYLVFNIDKKTVKIGQASHSKTQNLVEI